LVPCKILFDASGEMTDDPAAALLALNDVHWQCESQSFGNFFHSLREMMAQRGDWSRGAPFEPAFVKFLDELFPGMDEKARYAELINAFDTEKLEQVKVTLKEVSFIKLFTDAYFLHKIQPNAQKELVGRMKVETGTQEAAE
jgi:hypothetical protein